MRTASKFTEVKDGSWFSSLVILRFFPGIKPEFRDRRFRLIEDFDGNELTFITDTDPLRSVRTPHVRRLWWPHAHKRGVRR